MNHRHFLLGLMMLAMMIMNYGTSISKSLPLNPQNMRGADGKRHAICSASALNIRSAPSTKGSIVAKASQGERVEIIDEKGEWIQIRTKEGKVGWGVKKYFRILEEMAEPAEQPQEKPKQEMKKTPEIERANAKAEPASRPQRQKSSLSFGVVGGAALSMLAGKDASSDFSTRLGFTGGVLAYFPLGKSIGIQPEVLYVMKGAVKKTAGVEATLQLDYVEAPILCRVALSSGKNSSLHLLLGPTLSYNIQAVVTHKDSGEPAQEFTDVKKMDFGLSFGGGYQTGSFIVEARYGLGLSTIHDEKTDPLDLKNTCIALSLGWMIR